MNLVNDIFGTDLNDGVQLAIIFAILLVILLLVVWLIRVVFGNNVSRITKSRQPRLAVMDAAIVDDKRRLVLVRRDDVEHLILIGGNSDVLVESNISRVTPVQVPVTEQTESKFNTKENSTKRSSNEQAFKPSPKSFGTNIGGADKTGDSTVAKVASISALGAGVIAAASKTAIAKVGAGVTDSVAAIKDTATKATSEVVSGAVEKTTDLTKVGVESVKNTVVEASNESAKAIVDVAKGAEKGAEKIDVKKTEVKADGLGASSANEKSVEDSLKFKNDADTDLEKALNGEDNDTSDPADDDMQKILDELTAEIK